MRPTWPTTSPHLVHEHLLQDNSYRTNIGGVPCIWYPSGQVWIDNVRFTKILFSESVCPICHKDMPGYPIDKVMFPRCGDETWKATIIPFCQCQGYKDMQDINEWYSARIQSLKIKIPEQKAASRAPVRGGE